MSTKTSFTDMNTSRNPPLNQKNEDMSHGKQDNIEASENENINPLSDFNNKRIILRKFTVYNSQNVMYIVGSNAKESLFRILEIGKSHQDETRLTIVEDRNFFYTRKDMIELMNSLNESLEGGLHKLAQGYGMLGLIKFTKGYYLSLITKCSQIAVLGGHYIYHIDETKLIPLDYNYKKPTKYSDEERLLNIYKYLDLQKTFYFSYTYDITNTLQTNVLRHKKVAMEYRLNKHAEFLSEYFENSKSFDHNERFVWNKSLLKPLLENHDIAVYEWFQPMIHGFIDQANVSIYGRKVYITLIARRSHHFAGARFLKRGVNDKGDVANEVETEQITSDMLTSSFHDSKYGFFNNPRFTSFVQHRGSIPLYWTQDLNKLPTPPIEVNLSDPFYRSSAAHFNSLLQRHGSPIIILNLIKTKEKQPRELKLNLHFLNCIKYLNQFLDGKDILQYNSFDMSKHSKKNLDVIIPLQSLAIKSISQVGFFHNGTSLQNTKLQKGVIRTNCIDCLDRTNAAQFIICKEALSHQLTSLGIKSESTNLDYDSDIVNILTEIFHDHGDTIAVQYGGSNLVNTMDSYRRINQWSSHARDILNSIKRIYSNSFMDQIRQEAINLFLGNYEYSPDRPKLWELQNDFYLHNEILILDIRLKRSYTHWYNEKFLSLLRFDVCHLGPIFNPNYLELGVPYKLEPFPDYNGNWFNECYVTRKFQSLQDLFEYNMNSNTRYFPPSVGENGLNNFDYSPFKSRKHLAPNSSGDINGYNLFLKMSEQSENKENSANPNRVLRGPDNILKRNRFKYLSPLRLLNGYQPTNELPANSDLSDPFSKNNTAIAGDSDVFSQCKLNRGKDNGGKTKLTGFGETLKKTQGDAYNLAASLKKNKLEYHKYVNFFSVPQQIAMKHPKRPPILLTVSADNKKIYRIHSRDLNVLLDCTRVEKPSTSFAKSNIKNRSISETFKPSDNYFK